MLEAYHEEQAFEIYLQMHARLTWKYHFEDVFVQKFKNIVDPAYLCHEIVFGESLER